MSSGLVVNPVTNYVGQVPGALADIYANIPAAGYNLGDWFLSTDTKKLYRWDGAAWVEVLSDGGGGGAATWQAVLTAGNVVTVEPIVNTSFYALRILDAAAGNVSIDPPNRQLVGPTGVVTANWGAAGVFKVSDEINALDRFGNPAVYVKGSIGGAFGLPAFNLQRYDVNPGETQWGLNCVVDAISGYFLWTKVGGGSLNYLRCIPIAGSYTVTIPAGITADLTLKIAGNFAGLTGAGPTFAIPHGLQVGGVPTAPIFAAITPKDIGTAAKIQGYYLTYTATDILVHVSIVTNTNVNIDWMVLAP